MRVVYDAIAMNVVLLEFPWCPAGGSSPAAFTGATRKHAARRALPFPREIAWVQSVSIVRGRVVERAVWPPDALLPAPKSFRQ